jgi:hypothetical protein
VGGLCAVGRLGVATDLDLQDLEGRCEVWLEEDVENLSLLLRRVVLQQPRAAAAAAQPADAVELGRTAWARWSVAGGGGTGAADGSMADGSSSMTDGSSMAAWQMAAAGMSPRAEAGSPAPSQSAI